MKLYKRAESPYWWYSFTVNGKRFRGNTQRPLKDKKGAKEFLSNEYSKRLNMAQLGYKPEITMSDAFDLTIDETEGQTQRIYKSQRVKLLKLFSPDMLLSDFTQVDLDRLMSKRKAEKVQGNTLRCEIKFLRRAFRRVRHTHNVNLDLDWPRIKGFTKTRYLSQAEEDAVLARLLAGETVTDRKAYDLAVVLLDTGMRLMEAVELEWGDINLTNGVIEVYRLKTKVLSMVPISNRVHAILSRKTNQPFPFEKMEWAIKHLRKIIGEECNTSKRVIDQRGKATVHSLRDTYATRLLQRGMSLHKLSKLLGHSTITQTAKYAQLEDLDVVAEAKGMLDAG